MTLHLTELTSGDENWVIIDIDCDRSDKMLEHRALSPVVFMLRMSFVFQRRLGA